MANGKQASARRMKMAERAAGLMEIHFPGAPKEWLWQRRTNDGFTTLPRTLPIAMQAIDNQTKGKPAGHVLFCLWARAPDHPLVVVENPATFAAEAGFGGIRAVDTWRRRMKTLHDLGFIVAKTGASGDYHYVLLLNPNTAVELMHRKKLIQSALYARFYERVAEVGALGELQALQALWNQQAQDAASADSAA